MKTIDLTGEHEAKTATIEIGQLKYFEHPNIVKCYETFSEEDQLYLIMEYCEKGFSYLRLC